MPLLAETQELQQAFAKYCRDPRTPVAGIPQDRLDVYRSLVFGAVSDALHRAYPLTAQILGEESWMRLVESFFAEHPSTSPHLWQMPRALIDYLDGSKLAQEYPFLLDLVKFEWIEIEVHMMEDGQVPAFQELSGDLQEVVLAVNPDYRFLDVGFPVHREFERDKLTPLDEPVSLLVFRDRQSLQVRFIELSQPTRFFLQAMIDSGTAPAALIELIETSTGQSFDRAAITNLLDLLREENFILGKNLEIVDE